MKKIEAKRKKIFYELLKGLSAIAPTFFFEIKKPKSLLKSSRELMYEDWNKVGEALRHGLMSYDKEFKQKRIQAQF